MSDEHFTLVFSGDIKKLPKNPFTTKTIYGLPTGVSIGNALEDNRQAIAAIQFALNINDHYDMREFLRGWNEGDTSEWPEFSTQLSFPERGL